MATISNMTVDELKKFVEALIDERLTRLLNVFEIPEEFDEEYSLTWDEIRAAVERVRWTPPPNTKSALQLLRGDRET
jgi:hypothetical protein